MNYCDYDSLTHYDSGTFNLKYKTDLSGNLKELPKATLINDDVHSFLNGEYKTYITLCDLILYRVYGKIIRNDLDERHSGAKINGRYVSTEFAESLIDVKNRLALDPSWMNTKMFEAKILVPSGTEINYGIVAPVTLKSGTVLEGGADQIMLPENWSTGFIVGYRRVTTHQLINPPLYTMLEPVEKVSREHLYTIPACPYCGCSDVDILSKEHQISIRGSKGTIYKMRYKCNNPLCEYYW